MSTRSPRNAFIDHVRIVLTILVILHHAAIVYGGAGGWYWRQEPNASNQWLLFFNAVNQSFFMGFFFLLAGYYTPKSYDRKGAKNFLIDRFWRLGLPLVGYLFILSPMTIALARTSEGHPFWSSWWLMTRMAEFEPGPLWFAEALLIFALGYVGWRQIARPSGEGLQRLPVSTQVVLTIIAVGVTAFLVRLIFPTGVNIAWLQIGYFPAYIVLFVAGCLFARSRALEQVTLEQAKPWAMLSILMLVLMPVMIVTRGDRGSFSGGWNFNAAFYAFWDPLIAWGIILTLLWSFRTYWSTERRLTSALAERAYAAYIVHPPVLVAFSLWAREWSLPPLLKFGMVGILATAGAFSVASLLLLIPGSRRIL